MKRIQMVLVILAHQKDCATWQCTAEIFSDGSGYFWYDPADYETEPVELHHFSNNKMRKKLVEKILKSHHISKK